MEMDLTSLREAGLTDGEIKVYLALLELGLSTTGPIVDASGVSRSIIYQLLERLREKGLASFIIKEKTKYFQAVEPNKIIEYIDEREQQLQKTKKEVEQLLPQLLLKQKLVKKSEAQIYTGFKGIRTAHEHTYLKLKHGEEYTYLGIPAYQPPEQHLYWKRDHVRRARVGIRCRLLFNAGTDPAILADRNSYAYCDARTMPIDIVTPAAFLTYKDTTLILTQAPVAMAVEIVQQDVADSFKGYFEAFWKRTKPFRR